MAMALDLVIDAAKSSSVGPAAVDLVIGVTVGIGLYLGGLAFLLWPEGIASVNDTRGPRWIRDVSPHGPDPARPGRTSPKLILGAGVLLLVMGVALLIGIAIDSR